MDKEPAAASEQPVLAVESDHGRSAAAAASPLPEPAVAGAAAPPVGLQEDVDMAEAPAAVAGRPEKALEEKAAQPAAVAHVHDAEEDEPETAADLLGVGGADMMLDYEAEDDEPAELPAEAGKSPAAAAPGSTQQQQQEDKEEEGSAEQGVQGSGVRPKEGVRDSPAADDGAGARKRRHERISFAKEVKRKPSNGTPAAAAADDGSFPRGDSGVDGKENDAAAAPAVAGTQGGGAGAAAADAADKKPSGREGGAAGRDGKGVGSEGNAGSSHKRKHSPIPAFIPRTSSGGTGAGPPAVKRQLSGERSAAAAAAAASGGSGGTGLVRTGSSRQDPDPNVNREKAVAAAEAAGPPPDHASSAILVQNLARPFNEQQQLELLGQTGLVAGLWTARIKTHCYVVYEDKQQAWATLKALQGISWPKGNKKTLAVKFVEEDVAKEAIKTQMDPVSSGRPGVGGGAGSRAAAAVAAGAGRDGAAGAASAGTGAAAPKPGAATAAAGLGSKPSILDRLGDRVQADDSREERGSKGRHGREEATPPAEEGAAADREEPRQGRKVQQQEDKRRSPPAKARGMVTLDELFHSTKVAKPMLYWLPLSDEEVAAKRARRAALEGGPGAYKEPMGSAVQEGLPHVHTNR